MLLMPMLAAIDPKVVFSQLMTGFEFTIRLFLFTLIFAMPLGMLVAFCRMSKFTPLRWFTKLYISIMRGTPLMLQLMVVFYGPSYLFKGFNLERFPAAVIAFSINYAAYFAEIYRGGIESIPKGQYEAAQVLGYNKVQTFVRIILPQVLRNVLPAITNEVITLVKDTSLASVIAYTEMFAAAKRLSAKYMSLLPYVGSGLFYYVTNYIVSMVMELFEKKLNYNEK